MALYQRDPALITDENRCHKCTPPGSGQLITDDDSKRKWRPCPVCNGLGRLEKEKDDE